MTATRANELPVPALGPHDCLFVDLDGTLLDLRDDPRGVPADPALLELLRACARRLDGALAIISGRQLEVIDACLAPARFPAAGLHGLERRDFSGMTNTVPVAGTPLRDAAGQLARVMEGLPMTILEDKGASLALHWRRAPRHEAALREHAGAVLRSLGTDYRLLEGNCVVELVPRSADKGEAVRAFMREAPFAGRRPVVVGDDITDLSAFAAAAELGGRSVAVGERVSGDYHLADVAAVRAWLGAFAHE